MTESPANPAAPGDWVPDSCTLPTVEQPVRHSEIDDLFAHHVLSVTRESDSSTRLALRTDPDTASLAAALAVKESSCCSFFTFLLVTADGRVELVVGTAPTHREVLVALTDRAEQLRGGPTPEASSSHRA